MGTAFIAVADAHGNNAVGFYNMFPAEAVLPSPEVMQIQDVVRVRNPSLGSLLQAIVRKRDRDVVVVSHGSDTQLMLQVTRGINIGVDAGAINALLGSDSDAELARRLRTRARNVTRIRSQIRAVQRMRLNRVEFRACRIGQSRPTLQALQRLFGAASTCGPKAFDGYGPVSNVRPTADASVLAAWQRAHPQHQSFGTAPDRFFWVNDGNSDPPTISHAFAESQGAINTWVTAKFPSGTRHNYRRGAFFYHMQTDMLANSSQRRGHRTFQSNFAFPNDPAYRNNLLRLTTQATPQPTRRSTPQKQGRGPAGMTTTRYAANTEETANPPTHRQPEHRAPRPEGLLA